MMPLAYAMRDAGNDVIFGTGDSFMQRLKGWGFPVRKVGEELAWGFERASQRFPELLNPERPEFGGAIFVDVLGVRSLEDMSVMIEAERPDLVVYEATDVGAAVAAGRAGVPAACFGISLWIEPFLDSLRSRSATLWEAASSEPSLDVTVGDMLLDQWPESMQTTASKERAARYQPLRPIPWADPSSDAPGWLGSRERPFVFVSLGTMFWGKDLLRKVIESLDGLDVDALVLAGADATPDELPSSDNVRVSGFIDQPAVLQRADLVIHHGGAGTILGSLANGLPQLILPEGADRPFTAANVKDAGAAIALEPRDASVDDIARAVKELMNENRYRIRAEEIGAEIARMPAPEEVVGVLEGLAADPSAVARMPRDGSSGS